MVVDYFWVVVDYWVVGIMVMVFVECVCFGDDVGFGG